jgi:hypothetical protein
VEYRSPPPLAGGGWGEAAAPTSNTPSPAFAGEGKTRAGFDSALYNPLMLFTD